MSNVTKKSGAPQPKAYFVQKVLKGETYLVMAGSRLEIEDEFQGMYFTSQAAERVVLMPPFEPKVLASMIHQNNLLAQCIDAMEVNIDGTGWELIPAHEADADAEERVLDAEGKPVLGPDGKPLMKPIQPRGRVGQMEDGSQKPEGQTSPFGKSPNDKANEQAKGNMFDKDTKPTSGQEPPDKDTTETQGQVGETDEEKKKKNQFAQKIDPTVPQTAQTKPGESPLTANRPQDPNGKSTTAEEDDAKSAQKPASERNGDQPTSNPKKQWAGKMDPAEKERLSGFFEQPYPGLSFMQIRRQLRRQIETVGYGFLEPLRNVGGEIVGLRNVHTYNTRFVKLDAPVLVTKTVTRNGKEVELQMWERERRFMQFVPGHPNEWVYFREYGTTRQLHRKTGKWETKEHPVAPEDRGGELMVFGVIPDVNSPYYVPRWLNQMPSVVGSRKAEEENLEYLDSGGMPSSLIFVQGGTMGQQTADELRGYLTARAKTRNRAVVIELQSNSGSFDQNSSPPQVKVERFGSEKVMDSMFREYDKACGEHIRTGFRLPPLFIGLAQDYNFATAYTAYMVAEAQVFDPERKKFDEYINATLMKELKAETCKFHSLPLTLKNVEVQLQAMGLVAGQVDGATLVDEINKLAGLTLEYKEPPPPPNPFGGPEGASGEDGNPFKRQDGEPNVAEGKAPGAPKDAPEPGGKLVPFKRGVSAGGTPAKSVPGGGFSKKSSREMLVLVQKYLRAEGLTVRKFEMSEADKQEVYDTVDSLSESESEVFFKMLAASTSFGSAQSPVHKHDEACNQLHSPPKEPSFAKAMKPVMEMIAKRDDQMLATQEVLADLLEQNGKNTEKLLETISKQAERPIEVTVVNEAKKNGNKEFQFSDGRVVKLREVGGA